MNGKRIERGAFKYVDLDIKTGQELGINYRYQKPHY
jgi:hypothetical protein